MMPTKMNTVLGQLNLWAIPQKCYISNYDSLHLIEEGWHWGREPGPREDKSHRKYFPHF